MRIALDARSIIRPDRRGIGQAMLRLYQHLSVARPDWRFIALHERSEDVSAWFGDASDRLPTSFEPRRVRMPGDRVNAWLNVALPVAARWHGADLLHCQANECPPFSPVPTLCTVHDVIPLTMPDTQSDQQSKRFARGLANARRVATTLHCPSLETRRRLIEDHGFTPGQVTVTPWGFDQSMAQVHPRIVAKVRDRLRLSGPIVLHFGAADPRKNTARVLEAWALLRSELRKQWRLVILGAQPEVRPMLREQAKRLGVDRSVWVCGFVSDRAKRGLLNLAEILVYPSLAEGFGLPVLEGFATGTAVLTSDCTSLPEVAGDAAVLVDPYDTGAIRSGLHGLMNDRLYRGQMKIKGRRRCRQFAWDATAEQFANLLEQTATKRRTPQRRAA